MNLESETVEKVKHLLNKWDIRVFMVVSLLIQAILTVLAPYRKRCANGLFLLCVWLLYLSADAVALFTIGLILSSDADSPPGPQLSAFWAPFLLLHLGGPDTISALALEDNELWLRHGLQLVTQAVITLYVFGLSVRIKNSLCLPTMLMFADGCMKYIERTCALYFASTDTFSDSLSKNTEIKSDHCLFRSKQMGHGEVTETDMISDAYTAYTMFKGLLVDSALTFDDSKKSRTFFMGLDPKNAIKIIEIELNLIYDIFYTKATLLLNKKGLLFGRVVCFLSVVVAALLFCFADKTKYNKTDVWITCVLLVGAVVLDLYAVLKLFVSDWFIIKVPSYQNFSIKFRNFLSLWIRGYSRRWSESISQYNVLECCRGLHPIHNKYIFVTSVKDVFIGWFYVRDVPVDDGKLVEFVTQEIYEKAKIANDDASTSSSRFNPIFQTNSFLVPDILRDWTYDLNYDEIVLTWHVATDLCYRTDNRYCAMEDKECVGEALCCKLSKQLSDYMLYVILRQRPMLSSIAGLSDMIFERTTLYGMQLLAWVLERNKEQEGNDRPETVLERFSDVFMSDAGKEESVLKKQQPKKVVFYNACKLAEKLRSLEENQWEITSKVWVHLLCYAARRSHARLHVARLNAGGELITMTWLLMAHLGLAGNFQQANKASLLENLKDK
ncbi:unnamed protein product [Amaranthus hypochondriacus]